MEMNKHIDRFRETKHGVRLGKALAVLLSNGKPDRKPRQRKKSVSS